MKSAIPANQLASLALNPQALISASAQEQIKNTLASLNLPVDRVFTEIIQALKDSLASAITETFLIAFIVAGTAFVINLFLREIPLRKRQNQD